MANTKNTIQNISLTGQLCLNTLKTDVTQFEGYNEKNSTVFGGALNPFWEKSAELFDKDTSFSFFNSKGNCFSLVKEGNKIKLYKGDTLVDGVEGTFVTKTTKLDVPVNVIAAAMNNHGDIIYVTKDGSVYKNNTSMGHFTITNLFEAQIWCKGEDFFAVAVSNQKCQLGSVINAAGGQSLRLTSEMPLGRTLTANSNPLILGGVEGDEDITVYIVPDSGQLTSGSGINSAVKFTYRALAPSPTGETVTSIKIEDLTNPLSFLSDAVDLTKLTGNNTLELTQFASRLVESSNGTTFKVGNKWVGVANGFVPCPVGVYSTVASIYYLNGGLISIGSYGEPIDSCRDFGRTLVSTWKENDTFSITYQKNNGEWYNYTVSNIADITEDIPNYLERMLFDNQYIFFKTADGLKVWDMEIEGYLTNASYQDWIISEPPYSSTEPTETTGSIYGAAFNAGFEISNSKFVGLIMNPFVVSYSPSLENLALPDTPQGVQYYCSTGNTVQSAIYFGRDPSYYGTPYAVSENGNAIMPVSLNAKIIPGYSNNDLIKEGNVVFPLMYWNNNQKLYAYYIASAVENMESVFSLQGQSFSVDDTSIYSMTFSSGVVSGVTPICYKKNMIFVGTLPTQAVFWSRFNKTFYSFTGDRILSKMFEASDINTIHYVGQNPSSLSLWICTDTGIYIMSETDMYKLDFESHYVSFHDKFAYILAEDETNRTVHAITLYKNDKETDLTKIPVKLATKFYGLGGEKKSIVDCWYIRVWDKDHTAATIKVRDTTITDVTKVTHEKSYRINKDDYDSHDIAYIRHQPQFQECVAMQLELESPISIYSLAVGVNATDVAQVSRMNF